MNSAESYFEDLLMRVIEGVASEEEFVTFAEIVRHDAELRRRYAREMRLHALLSCQGEAMTVSRGSTIPAWLSGSWWKVAAAVALLLGVATAWYALDSIHYEALGVGSEEPVILSYPPVRLVRQTETAGLKLPEVLPGSLQLSTGEGATVRLMTGVELSLLGPVRLEVLDGLQVRLESGSLLANVPHWVTGFRVHALGLEVLDLGTVFSVSTAGGVSDVFVFKGSVQVNKGSGEEVGLCEAGEGVRTIPGERPQLFAADWAEARWLFAAVRDNNAVRDPVAALSTAGQIGDMWYKRYMSVAAPGSLPGLRGTGASGNQIATGVRGGTVCPPITAAPMTVPGIATTVTRTSAPETKESEMKATNAIAAVAAAAVLGTAGSALSVPEVSNVRMQQRGLTRVVDVWYDLSGQAAIVTMGVETNGAPLPDHAVTRLSGDVSVVTAPGTDRHIVWNAGADWPEHSVTNAKARVTAWSTNAPPLYMVVDLSGGQSATAYPVSYYVSTDALPDGGLTNDLYRLDRLLMRRIRTQAAYPENGVFMMGSPTGESGRSSNEDRHQVTLTSDYYMGVFEVTQWQFQQVRGRWSYFNNADYWMTRPAENVSYDDIRGSSAQGGAGWPTNNSVYAQSFMGLLRTKTGLAGFDLPTEAQWEYACRAGTSGALNDGTVNITNVNSDARLNLLGRYRYSGGYISGSTVPAQTCTTANGTAKVGTYVPNAWGMYDMHGNVWEWCLDWYIASLGTGTVQDPVGAPSGTGHAVRSGRWSDTAGNGRSAWRDYGTPSYSSNTFGFRLVRILN